jgi:Raf kinase inhibitor-like YbhB/YbcL family protein
MQLSSPAFENNQAIPPKYAYRAGNTNPPLVISDIPGDAKTIALIVNDPDAPSGNFIHWLAWNIHSDALEINEGTLPTEAIQGRNDFGNNHYDGPAPPSGTHRYIFTAYALSSSLNLKAGASHSDLELAMIGRVLAQAQLGGLYSVI